MNGPLTREGLRVCAEPCSTCIFRPGNLMSLQPGRVRSMIEQSLAADSFITCHKTLDGERAVCRGFYDLHRTNSLGLRLGAILGVIETNPEGERDD